MSVEPEQVSVFLTSTLGSNDTNKSLKTSLVSQYFLTSDVQQNYLKSFFDIYLLGLTPGNTEDNGDKDQGLFRKHSWLILTSISGTESLAIDTPLLNGGWLRVLGLSHGRDMPS